MNIRIIIYSIVTFFITSTLSQELSENYESKTAAEKLEELWEKLSSADPGKDSIFSLLLSTPLIFLEQLNPTFDHFKDTLPYDHDKRIHPTGGVAKATWKSVGDHPYTGLFVDDDDDDGVLAVVRFSTAVYPIFPFTYTPGIGVKLFRDGVPSANFVAMNSVDGQGSDGNFFAKNFSNHIPDATGGITRQLAGHFEQFTSKNVSMVGLSDVASRGRNGTAVENVVSPFQLRLVPNDDLRNKYEGYDQFCSKNLLTSVPSGTKLWDVFAIGAPNDTDWTRIAELTTTSDIIYSKAGDKCLFFRHQRIEDDFALYPEWEQTVQNKTDGRRLSACPGLRNLRYYSDE